MQLSHYRTPSVPVSEEVREVLSLRKDFVHDATCQHSVLLAPEFSCEAFADACADSVSVGIVKFPSGSKRFFVSFTRACLCLICPFLGSSDSFQAFIASFELLAQSALVWTIQAMLPLGHPPLRVVLRCDNSASEASAWKGFCLWLRGSVVCFAISVTSSTDLASLLTLNTFLATLQLSGSWSLKESLLLGGSFSCLSGRSQPLSRLIFLVPFLLFVEWLLGAGPAGSILIRLSLDFCPPHSVWLWCSLSRG